jgi:hypothetical protein
LARSSIASSSIFWLCFRLYFLVPDADVYAHVKRHQVLILYTWSPNLGVRKLAPATHPSLEPADSFGIGLLECDSPHILHFFCQIFSCIVCLVLRWHDVPSPCPWTVRPDERSQSCALENSLSWSVSIIKLRLLVMYKQICFWPNGFGVLYGT